MRGGEKAIASLSDADLIARRDALNAEIERRKGEAIDRLHALGAHEPPRVFQNPRVVKQWICPNCNGTGLDAKSSSGRCTACLGWANEITVRPDAQDSNAAVGDPLEIPPFLRREPA